MKEWYLTTPVPNITGFESDVISQYAQSNFTDLLSTDFADSVTLYNADLSVGENIKCIIQGNTADTQLKFMERTILTPIGVLHGGDYIYFEDSYWIVDGRPGNNKSYEKSTLKLCQYKIKWQKDDGTVVERWCNLTSASKYDVGEGRTNTIILSSNNYTILIPHDDDGQTIEGKRIFIDTSNNPRKVFKITRNDDPLFLYGSRGGVLNLIADKTEININTDRPDLGLCDYIDVTSTFVSPPPHTPHSESNNFSIGYVGQPTVRMGGNAKTFKLNSEDNFNETVIWKIKNYREGMEVVDETSDSIKIKIADDEALLAHMFVLEAYSSTELLTSLNITIVD